MDTKEKLAFFLNLFNFAVLLGLCKNMPKIFPKCEKDWVIFTSQLNIQAGIYKFTVLEIQHGILRASMSYPKVFEENSELWYPIFTFKDPKIVFKFDQCIPLINFGFYYAISTSPVHQPLFLTLRQIGRAHV